MSTALRQVLVAIEDQSAVAEARRRAAALAKVAGLAETVAGKLSLAVTEAATNILKHAGRGRVVLQALESAGAQGVELLALDQGPGIRNLAESMRDGHSTAGSPGTGLGALHRMAANLDVYTQPDKGTILRLEFWRTAPPSPPIASGAISLPKPGETVCGDDWAILQQRGRVVVFVTDGLGHGTDAAAAARAAVAAVYLHSSGKPAEIIERVHDALRPTRGAAAAVAVLDAGAKLCTFCGVGNISASIHSGGIARRLVSHNGILGHQVRKVQEFQYPYAPGALLLAHSDGLVTHWDLGAYAGLESRHPALVAAALYRDFNRGRDDVTIVGVRA